MAACELKAKALAEGESEALSVSYPSGAGMTRLKAYVLDAETLAPLHDPRVYVRG